MILSPRRRHRRRRSSRVRRKLTSAKTIPSQGTGTRRDPLLCCVDACFVGLIFVLPFVFGGRQATGNFALVSLSGTVTVLWSLYLLRQRTAIWIWSGAEILLVTGIALVGLQLVSMPADWLNWISPYTAELLPVWREGATNELLPEQWTQISLTPTETFRGFLVLVSYALIFLIAVQRLQTRTDIRHLLAAVALSAGTMAGFGLIQRFTSNGRFFWFYEHPFTDTFDVVKGAFTNRNHFAHFLALGTGPLIWWLLSTSPHRLLPRFRRTRSRRKTDFSSGRDPIFVVAALLMLVLTVFAVLLSMSRGGATATLAAAFVCLCVAYRAGMFGGRTLIGFTAFATLTTVCLFIHGADEVGSRMEQLVTTDAERADPSGGRRCIWKAVRTGIRHFPLGGTGIGSHREVYPIFLEEAPRHYNHEFTHAESGYHQVPLEAGVPGFVLLLTGFGVLVARCVGVIRRGKAGDVACAGAILAATAASLVHSAVDFVWYVPGCMVILILLAAAGCRLHQMVSRPGDGTTSGSRLPTPIRASMVVTSLILAGWLIHSGLPPLRADHHWHAWLRQVIQESGDEGPVNDHSLLEQIRHLSRTCEADHHHARAQLRLAKAFLSAFQQLQERSENPISLGQIRDAALIAGFPDQDSLDDWLSRVVGPRRKYLDHALRHTQQALSLCPLQGQGYLVLSELGFLSMLDASHRDAFVQQAISVRPYDAQIRFAAGRTALMAGDPATAMDHWRVAFNRTPEYRRHIIAMLAPAVPAAFLIENFGSDVNALEDIVNRYRIVSRPSDLEYALGALGTGCEGQATGVPDNVAAGFYMRAQRAWHELGDRARTERSLELALRAAPDLFAARQSYGMLLYENGEFGPAAEHLAWCVRRRPEKDSLRKLARKARELSLTRGVITPTAAEADIAN